MFMIFGLLGGLAVFLYGMNMMSTGLQKVAGSRMKNILSMLTANPVIGVLAGTLATVVLQSSSATTVMAIGFVSARLMSLRQAIALIFGANIGTTVTAQLIAFKLSDYIWIIVFIGFLIWFVSKDAKIKNIGQTIFAFGLLFVGIDVMGDVMKPLASSEFFIGLIHNVSEIPVLGVGVGALMTVVVQSSSASIAVLQSLASTPGPDGVTSILGLDGALPILLGDNIGTTITAILASIGQSINAKRTAAAHCIFNITGVTVMIFLLPLMATWVQFLSPGAEVDVIARQIANAHTTFNIVCTLCWLPFIGFMVKIVTKIIPEKKRVRPEGSLVYLNSDVISTPVFAVKMYAEELQLFCNKVRENLQALPGVLNGDKSSSRDKLIKDIELVSVAEGELSQYALELYAAGTMTENQTIEVSDLSLVADTVGRLNARCQDICEIYAKHKDSKDSFSEAATQEIYDSLSLLSEIYSSLISSLDCKDCAVDADVNALTKKFFKAHNKIRKNHFKRLGNKDCATENKKDFNDLITLIERACVECVNLLEHAEDLRRWQDDTAECSISEDTDFATDHATSGKSANASQEDSQSNRTGEEHVSINDNGASQNPQKQS